MAIEWPFDGLPPLFAPRHICLYVHTYHEVLVPQLEVFLGLRYIGVLRTSSQLALWRMSSWLNCRIHVTQVRLLSLLRIRDCVSWC